MSVPPFLLKGWEKRASPPEADKPEGQGGKLRFLRFGRPPKVDPPLAENNKRGRSK